MTTETLMTTKSGAQIEPYDVVCVQYLDESGRADGGWMDYSSIKDASDAREAVRLVEGRNRWKRFQIVRRGARSTIVYG